MEPQIIAPKKKLNLVWIIAGFIVAVAVGLMFWSLSNSPIPSNDLSSITSTSDWQTYRSEEDGYEFKYPSDWNECEGVFGYVCSEGSSDILEVMMGLENSYPGITNADQLKTHYENQQIEFEKFPFPVSKKNFGGADFVLSGGCNDFWCDHHNLVFLKNGRLLLLTYRTDRETSITMDQILSTFKFLE